MSRSQRKSSKGAPSSMGAALAKPQRQPRRIESIESQRRRNEAAEILQSYEQLSWYAYQRCETITQTRLHFRCIVAGISPEQEDANAYWKEDFTPHPVHASKHATTSRKGKERLSSGSAGGTKAIATDKGRCTSSRARSSEPEVESGAGTRAIDAAGAMTGVASAEKTQ